MFFRNYFHLKNLCVRIQHHQHHLAHLLKSLFPIHDALPFIANPWKERISIVQGNVQAFVNLWVKQNPSFFLLGVSKDKSQWNLALPFLIGPELEEGSIFSSHIPLKVGFEVLSNPVLFLCWCGVHLEVLFSENVLEGRMAGEGRRYAWDPLPVFDDLACLHVDFVWVFEGLTLPMKDEFSFFRSGFPLHIGGNSFINVFDDVCQGMRLLPQEITCPSDVGVDGLEVGGRMKLNELIKVTLWIQEQRL